MSWLNGEKCSTFMLKKANILVKHLAIPLISIFENAAI